MNRFMRDYDLDLCRTVGTQNLNTYAGKYVNSIRQ